MTEVEWFKRDDAAGLVWHLNSAHKVARTKVGKRKLRLFCCACVRQIGDLIRQEETRAAVEVGERFANSAATAAELEAARSASFHADQKLARAVGTEAGNAVLYATAKSLTEKVLKRCTMYACLARFHALVPNHRGPVSPLSPEYSAAARAQADALRDIFGNPFHPVAFAPEWRTTTAVSLARQMYEARDFSALPILADALQDAGCTSTEILNHCRDPEQVHVRGCWVCDLVLV
jgi:hypothetical protein